jgi:hypothetical protein
VAQVETNTEDRAKEKNGTVTFYKGRKMAKAATPYFCFFQMQVFVKKMK